MSAIVNKRKLMEATQAFIKASQPTVELFKNMSGAMAQCFTDMSGVDCKLVIQVKKADLKEENENG